MDQDLTVGAAFIVGWVLGAAYTLTVIRLTRKILAPEDRQTPPPE